MAETADRGEFWPLTERRLKWLYVVVFGINGASIVTAVYPWQAWGGAVLCVCCTFSTWIWRRELDHR